MKKTILVMAAAACATAGITLAAPASAAPNTDSGDASAKHAYCGRPAPPNLDGWIDYDAPVSGAVNQRNGTIASSSTNCPILGSLQPTDDAEYYCYTWGNDGYSWTYLRNTRTNVRGWSRDNLLDDFGSGVYCGF
jgi:hypothetical protein